MPLCRGEAPRSEDWSAPLIGWEAAYPYDVLNIQNPLSY